MQINPIKYYFEAVDKEGLEDVIDALLRVIETPEKTKMRNRYVTVDSKAIDGYLEVLYDSLDDLEEAFNYIKHNKESLDQFIKEIEELKEEFKDEDKSES